MTTKTGGCHCGAVKFRVTFSSLSLLECNCSICSKKGYLHLIVGKDDFELLTPQDKLSSYRFGTGVANHLFCSECGVHSFYVPRSHPDGVSVNARTLDDVELKDFDIKPFDGKHWDEQIHSLPGATGR